MFIGENTSIKIRFMLSHLIWILLYDNQTLKTALSKNEYIQEIKNLNIHLQKEYDMNKFQKQFGNIMINEEQMKLKEDKSEKNNGINLIDKTTSTFSGKIQNAQNENKPNNKKEKEYLENTCLNLRKILHILEL